MIGSTALPLSWLAARSYSFNFKLRFWLISFALLALSSQLLFSISVFSSDKLLNSIYIAVLPLLSCLLLMWFSSAFNDQMKQFVKYFVFFSIAATSALGLTKTLTGAYAASSTIFLYGFSFYTASIAYLIHLQQLRTSSIWTVSNPLLLITGPIATRFFPIAHHSLKSRFKYFFPYILLGLFLHQAIATPLTRTFRLIELTDIISSCVFAFLFELFVYANFCGLSLIIFGICGIIGAKVPLNFKQPFSSTNIVEYWRGWHTSLSTVLKSLFYTPAKRVFGTFSAIFVVYLSSAMWHGVTANFVLWGLFHASIFCLTIFFLKRGTPILPLVLMIISIVIGRLLFSDSNTSRLFEKLSFKYDGFGVLIKIGTFSGTTKVAVFLAMIFVGLEFACRDRKYFRTRNYKFFRLPVIQLIMLVIMLLTVYDGSGVDYAVYQR